MKTPHKHAALIKAWADGVEIQERFKGDKTWLRFDGFWIDGDFEYRIKPESRPDVIDYVRVGTLHKIVVCPIEWGHKTNANLKLTFDGETGKLKAAEVIA